MTRSVELGGIAKRATLISKNEGSGPVAYAGRSPEYGARLDQIREFWQGLPDKPEETPETSLRSLWLAAAGMPRSCAMAAWSQLPELTPPQIWHLDAMIRARQQGIPLAYLTGRQHFMGLELLASPEALIPRRETEILARAAIAGIRQCLAATGSALVLDICTGSGNLALAYAAHVPGNVRLYGSDLCAQAVALATRNARGLQLSDRVEFRCGDLFAPFDSAEFLGNVDVISCNPPYISTGRVSRLPHETAALEPRMAFDGGPFGVSILCRMISEAPRYLKPGGWLFLEVGAGQGPALVRRLRENPGITQVQTYFDAEGEARAVAAQSAP